MNEDERAAVEIELALLLSAATIECLLNLLIEEGVAVNEIAVIMRANGQTFPPTTPQIVLRNLKNMMGMGEVMVDIVDTTKATKQ